jgi:hypothetical protein
MNDDLTQLNRVIAAHWLGRLDPDEEAYLSHTHVCVGQLAHSAEDLARLLDCFRQERPSSLAVGELNRRYLNFARLAAKDAMAGNPDMLVKLGLTLRQAQWLGHLSDDDLDRIAFGIGTPMVRFTRRAFQRGVGLHAQAGKQHAAAFVAARPSSRETQRR